jgi:two-component system alkaline phosphatase synthesis response regulator PhoP
MECNMGSRSVLVVDDDRAIVDALATILTEEGYIVRRAYDGLSALEEAEIAPPDLVLSDIAMPGLDGIALTQRLRERGVPVVLLSAAMTDPEIPGVPYLPKPFDLEHLLAVAERVLDHSSDQRSIV